MPPPPINPDSFDKVNFVIDAWTTGCDAPWYIYVETMKPALLAAFITLITFGWDDVLRGFLRPRGLHPRRTGKRKGKWSRRVPRFPEIGELIGSNIPGADEVKGKRWSNAAKTLWRIDSAMQAVFFFWLVAEVAEDFAFEWTSLLYQSYWCQEPGLGRFSYNSPGYGTTPPLTWKKMWYGVEDYEEGPPFWTFGTGTTGSVFANVTATVNVKTLPPFPEPQSVRLVVRDKSTQEIYADSGTNDELVNGAGPVVANGVLPPGTAFEVFAWTEAPDFCAIGDGVVIGIEVRQ